MKVVLAFVLSSAVVAVAGFALPMCLPAADGCTPLATRCSGNAAEICDGDQRWGTSLDCNQVAQQSGGIWACCVAEVEAGATCLPKNDCPQGGDL